MLEGLLRDSISYRDGRLPGFPRATCELQGYAYDAKLRGARLARLVWKDPDFADRLEREPATSDGASTAISGWKTASTSRWLSTRRKQVSALASNNGHLLWNDIVDQTKARAVAEHLLGRSSSAAGACVRWPRAKRATTPLSTTSARSGPSASSFIAWGLRRYGFKEEAARIAAGIADAADFFAGRLRGVRGYPREQTKYPVQYPTACSRRRGRPGRRYCCCGRCWASRPKDEHLVMDPALPSHIGHLELLDIPGGGVGSTRSVAGESTSARKPSLARGRHVARNRNGRYANERCRGPTDDGSRREREATSGRRFRRLRDHGRPGEGDDVPFALPTRAARSARLPDQASPPTTGPSTTSSPRARESIENR